MWEPDGTSSGGWDALGEALTASSHTRAVVTDLRLRRLPTAALTPAEVDAIRAILVAAFGDDPDEAFTEDDWDHALGGTHVVVEQAQQRTHRIDGIAVIVN